MDALEFEKVVTVSETFKSLLEPVNGRMRHSEVLSDLRCELLGREKVDQAVFSTVYIPILEKMDSGIRYLRCKPGFQGTLLGYTAFFKFFKFLVVGNPITSLNFSLDTEAAWKHSQLSFPALPELALILAGYLEEPRRFICGNLCTSPSSFLGEVV